MDEGIPGPAETSHRQPPRWPAVSSGKVRVKAEVYAKHGGRRLWLFTRNPVDKSKWIKFTASTNVPPPYEVFWQVVNTGTVARQAGGLRGGFDKGSSGMYGEVRWEPTAYRGTHFMEAFVVKNGTLVARSGQVPVAVR